MNHKVLKHFCDHLKRRLKIFSISKSSLLFSSFRTALKHSKYLIKKVLFFSNPLIYNKGLNFLDQLLHKAFVRHLTSINLAILNKYFFTFYKRYLLFFSFCSVIIFFQNFQKYYFPSFLYPIFSPFFNCYHDAIAIV